MDRAATREAARLLGTLIGEIMEDHVDGSLSPPKSGDWAHALKEAGEDIAALAAAIAIVGRRAEW